MIFIQVHLQTLKWEGNIYFFNEEKFSLHSSSFKALEDLNKCKDFISFSHLKTSPIQGSFYKL